MYLSTLYISLGKTSLMYAANNGRPEVIKILLENNADVDTKNNEGRYLY